MQPDLYDLRGGRKIRPFDASLRGGASVIKGQVVIAGLSARQAEGGHLDVIEMEWKDLIVPAALWRSPD